MAEDLKQTMEKSRRNQEWIWTITMASSFFLCGMGNSSIAPYYPKVAVDKGMASSLMSFVLCIIYIPQLVMMFFNAILMLKCGASNIYKLGTLLFGVSTIAFGFTDLIDSITWFSVACICLKVVQGVGFSMILNSSSFIAAHEMPHKVSFVIGLMETGSGVGYTLGPLLGGYVYDRLGYAMPLVITGIPQIILLFVSFITLKGISKASSSELDGLTKDNKDKLKRVLPSFVVQLFINLLPFVLLCNFDIFIPLYGTMTLGESSSNVGLALGLAGVIYSITAVSIGTFADRKGKELWLIGIGLAVCTLLCIALACVEILNGVVPLTVLGTLFAALGVFSSLMYIPNISLFNKIARSHKIPLTKEVNSFVSTSIMAAAMIGQLIGTGASGIVYDYLGITNSSFTIAGILFLLFTLLITVVRPKLLKTSEEQPLLSGKDGPPL